MAKKRNSKSLHKLDNRGGGYTLLPHAVLDELLSTVGPRAVTIALAIVRRFNGFNNGRIGLSMRELAEAIGSANHNANMAALHELERAGFIVVASRFPKGQRRANEYRLTFGTYGPNGEHPATNEYLETEKFSVAATATRKPFRVATTATRRKHRVAATATGVTETCGFPDPLPVEAIATHIVNHAGGLSRSNGNDRSDASKSSGAISSGMTGDELRGFAMSFLAKAEPGTQSRLAHEVGVPGGTLSKFLGGRSLPDGYLMPLQLALGRRNAFSSQGAAAYVDGGETGNHRGDATPRMPLCWRDHDLLVILPDVVGHRDDKLARPHWRQLLMGMVAA